MSLQLGVIAGGALLIFTIVGALLVMARSAGKTAVIADQSARIGKIQNEMLALSAGRPATPDAVIDQLHNGTF